MRLLFAARALASFAAGVFLVFNQGHYVQYSLIALIIFALGTAVGQIAVALFGPNTLSSIESVPSSIISLTIGVLAVLAQLQGIRDAANPSVTIEVFRWLVTGWALTSGAFELYLARRSGFKTPAGRDYLILSVFGLALGLVYLVIHMDRTTTVGMFVAYLLFSAVHLGIAAASPKVEQGGKAGETPARKAAAKKPATKKPAAK
ncbi:MAG: hypothetical protein RLZZ443_896 [Actinomycetota bacterium]